MCGGAVTETLKSTGPARGLRGTDLWHSHVNEHVLIFFWMPFRSVNSIEGMLYLGIVSSREFIMYHVMGSEMA